MPNAAPEVVRLQEQVFDTLQEPIEQIEDVCTHGEFLTRTIRANANTLDAVVFFDLDCIPLKRGVVARAVRLAVHHGMVIGCAQQANHIEIEKVLQRRKTWPTVLRKLDSARIRFCNFVGIDPYHLIDPLIYAGPCFLVVPTKVYNFVGQPTLDVTSRADAAGELTIACRQHGVRVRCLQPTYCHVPKYKLGNVKRSGLGTTFGHCVFHAYETSCSRNTESPLLFRTYCERVIREQVTQKTAVLGDWPEVT